jgi:hypothetical protein
MGRIHRVAVEALVALLLVTLRPNALLVVYI